MMEPAESVKQLDALYAKVAQEVKDLECGISGDVPLPPDVAALQAENSKLEYRINILKRRAEEMTENLALQSSILDFLQDVFSTAIKESFPDIKDFQCNLTRSTAEKFGDYQCNSAMNIAQIMRQQGTKMTPMDCAEKIVAKVSCPQIIESLEIAKPGFINIRVKALFYSQRVSFLINEGVKPPMKKKKIVVDFSSPNIPKEMHVGHLRC